MKTVRKCLWLDLMHNFVTTLARTQNLEFRNKRQLPARTKNWSAVVVYFADVESAAPTTELARRASDDRLRDWCGFPFVAPALARVR